MIDLVSLETEAQICMLPFLRIASLVRHYLFQHPLPVIEETSGNIVMIILISIKSYLSGLIFVRNQFHHFLFEYR